MGLCLILSYGVFAHQQHDNSKRLRRCFIKQRPLSHVKKNRPLKNAGDCTMSRTNIQNEYWPSQTYTIPVVFHILHKTDGTGNISDQRILNQVKVLNEDYGAFGSGSKGYNTRIQFKLEKITRTANDSWFNDQNEVQYKQALGMDQKRYLNIYVNSASGYLGYAYLPQEDAGDVYDGVVILYESVGGRNNGYTGYDQGRTLVHEVGHYLGLLHTFEGYGCYDGYDSGDLIGDTNSENAEHYDCNQTSTCGTPDDIHNYMNYTEDTCMHEFTPDQANRMVCSLVNYRPNLYSVSGGGGGVTTPTISLTSPNGGERLTAGSTHTVTWTSTGTVGNVNIQYSVDNGSNWIILKSSTTNDGAYSWQVPNNPSTQCKVRIREAADNSPSDTSNSVFSIVASGGGGGGGGTSSGRISLSRNKLNFSAAGSARVTGSQQVWLNNTGEGTLNWSVSTDENWLNCSPSSGTDSGVLTVSVNPDGLGSGSYFGTVTVSAPASSNSPQTISVNMRVKSTSQDLYPIGNLSKTLDGVTVNSSIAVTGWAVDDVEVTSVEIYREKGSGSVYIGEAVFVEGARPDVEAAYPDYPANHRAGWGYMMLTNFIPDGNHSIYAEAIDSKGQRTRLGDISIRIDNSAADSPFGALDSPDQGGRASGSNYRNTGWVLTPLPHKIPTNGSTINVYVDGKQIGNPQYNVFRGDIAYFFPGYANSNGAHGYLDIDTTKYSNGVHSIQWVATDSGGNTDGIGSRYFTIANTGTKPQTSSALSRTMTAVNPTNSVYVKKGYRTDAQLQEISPGPGRTVNINIRHMERLEIHLPGSGVSIETLPPGSTLDRESSTFYWQPGPVLMGNFQLGFTAVDQEGSMFTTVVHVAIAARDPKALPEVLPISITK